ncbi:hypothetical protein BFAG_02595 [Bacteroides fragilis 3_1_12]|uniref:Uncharacterized protein n=1 Tax=Bacteroides fragilis 3_1_12 TaxID=457424 RepID=A0ABN0BLY1_BACFG|nr:hypothetical protein BFAG_02595 [Bacteroides fragilis 3_1_12]
MQLSLNIPGWQSGILSKIQSSSYSYSDLNHRNRKSFIFYLIASDKDSICKLLIIIQNISEYMFLILK